MNLIICDDEKAVLTRLSSMLTAMLPEEEHTITLCSSLAELKQNIQKQSCDLILLDIQMGKRRPVLILPAICMKTMRKSQLSISLHIRWSMSAGYFTGRQISLAFW